jgi:hypothetical protein
MSFDFVPGSETGHKQRLERLTAKADAYRAGRLAGRKPLLRRVLERLRPHRQEPGNEPHGSDGTLDGPGH